MATPTAAAPGAPPALSGRLVRLEPLAPGHLEGLLTAANQDPAEIFPFTWVPRERAALQRWLDEALALAAAGRAVPFATLSAATGQVLGSTRFGNLERWEWPDPAERRPSGLDAVEIGWTWLCRQAQRSGVNTEAKLLMLGHAFEGWRVRRVTLKTDARNQRSRAAIARLGASLDGLLRSHLPAADGGPRTSAVFSIVESEWPGVKARLEGMLGAR
jgi:RimJ/RimL family protein N-acetyltransferase